MTLLSSAPELPEGLTGPAWDFSFWIWTIVAVGALQVILWWARAAIGSNKLWTGLSESKKSLLRGVAALIAVLVLVGFVIFAGRSIASFRDATSTTPAVNESEQDSNPKEEASSYRRTGWGPDRQTATVDSAGLPYPTFNSITDSNIGDERNFIRVRNLSDPESKFRDDIWAKAGDTIEVMAYVNNSGYNNADSHSAGRIQDARLQLGVTQSDDEASVQGILTAANVKTTWDSARVHFDEGVELQFEPESAVLSNNVHKLDESELSLDPSIFSQEGVLLGYDEMDGEIRPGYQYAMYVRAKINVVEAGE